MENNYNKYRYREYHIDDLLDVFYNAPSVEDFKEALGIGHSCMHYLLCLRTVKDLREMYARMATDKANRRDLLSIVYKDNICSTIARFCFIGTDDYECVWINFEEREKEEE